MNQCPICKGTGEVQVSDVDFDRCRSCGGSGSLASSTCSLPEFTCEEIGGVFAIWWGDGPYLYGFGLDQKWLVETLCRELNKKQEAILEANASSHHAP